MLNNMKHVINVVLSLKVAGGNRKMKKELCSRSTRFLRRYLLLRGPHVCPLKIEIPFRLEDDRAAYGKQL